MISYDWRRCPTELPPLDGPAFPYPIREGIGTRATVERGFPPASGVDIESVTVQNTGLGTCWIIAGAMALWAMSKK